MKLPVIRPATGALWGVLLALVLVVGIGFSLGLELALLALAGSVLVSVIALFWLSVRNLSGEAPLSIDEALGMGAPTAAEEQKRAVLRALKDLEFERSVGKISEQDYLEFSARFRAEAKRLIAAVDESLGPVQQIAEKLANERLAQAGLLDASAEKSSTESAPTTPPAAADSPTTEEPDGAPPEAALEEPQKPDSTRKLSKATTCPSCKTENDPDAIFCKRCGSAIELPRSEAPARAVEEDAP
jgi:hypothetical protein